MKSVSFKSTLLKFTFAFETSYHIELTCFGRKSKNSRFMLFDDGVLWHLSLSSNQSSWCMNRLVI